MDREGRGRRGGSGPRGSRAGVRRCTCGRWARSTRALRRGELPHLPASELLLRVMALAEGREVGDRRGTAQSVVESVVDLAADGGHDAAGPPAVAVARAEVTVDRRRAVVGVGVENSAADGVRDHAVPRGGGGLREGAGGMRVDGAVSDQIGGVGVLGGGVEDAEGGHHDLYPGADGAEGSGSVVGAGGVGVGGRGEEEIGEDVGAQLRGGAFVRGHDRNGGGGSGGDGVDHARARGAGGCGAVDRGAEACGCPSARAATSMRLPPSRVPSDAATPSLGLAPQAPGTTSARSSGVGSARPRADPARWSTRARACWVSRS